LLVRVAGKAKAAWEDRFSTPLIDGLCAGLSKPHRTLLEHASTSLLALPGMTKAVSWLGVPWRWTICFRSKHVAVPDAVAYLVPQPSKPLICVPVPERVVTSFDLKTSRTLRDGIAFAPLVGGAYWSQWELVTKSQIDEVVDLVRMRVQGREVG
jgi:hypothetical protein